jgi:hypothetical protein
MANDGDDVALPARLHLQDREAVVLVMKLYPLDRAGERLTDGASGATVFKTSALRKLCDFSYTTYNRRGC